MRKRISGLLIVVAALGITGCVGGSAEKKKENQEALKAYVLDKPPPDVGAKLNIEYDKKITLLGAKVEPSGTARPGQRIKLTMYWKVDKEIGEKGWQLFTHVLDGAGARILNVDNVGPLRRMQGREQALPPSSWEAGKVYVDEQQFTLPKKLKTSKAVVTVGIWKGNSRLPITGGPKDRDNRGQVATIQTTATDGDDKVSKRATRVPEVRVDKLEKNAVIKIDGKLDEEAWKTAPKLGPFVDVRTGRENKAFPVGGSVKLAWDDKGVYFGFEVTDPDIVADFDKNAKDPHLWEKDTVEIMIDPDGDGDNRDYYEIQINPQNLVFDSRFDTYNQPKKLPDGPFGHQDWSAKVKSAVTVNGTIGKSDDKDEGYVVEAMVPWSSFDKAEKVPPAVGQTWRMNFYAMQNNSGVAWSPILGQGNFHRASRFGKVLWADKTWTPAAAADEAVTRDSLSKPARADKTAADKTAKPAAAEKTAKPAAAEKTAKPTAAEKTAKPAVPKSLKAATSGPAGIKMEMAPAAEQKQKAAKP